MTYIFLRCGHKSFPRYLYYYMPALVFFFFSFVVSHASWTFPFVSYLCDGLLLSCHTYVMDFSFLSDLLSFILFYGFPLPCSLSMGFFMVWIFPYQRWASQVIFDLNQVKSSHFLTWLDLTWKFFEWMMTWLDLTWKFFEWVVTWLDLTWGFLKMTWLDLTFS